MRHRSRRHIIPMLIFARAARTLRPAPRRSSVRMLASRMPTLELRDASTKQIVPVGNCAPLKWYACGPTVYDATHLGHARTYVTLDLVRRAAETFGGATIDFAMGVTDIDDKIIKRAAELEIEPLELARREEANFFEDLDRLGCREPTLVLRVSEHIEDIVKYIEEVVEKGYGYTTSDGVWFDVAKLGPAYGAFAEGRGTSTAAAQAAALVAEDAASISDTKRDGRDFALWKAAKANEPAWPSPWGEGRPGWHIECSAMTRAAFGQHLDLHAGGVDLAFPHHENEIAQWRGCNDDLSGTWCSCWLHTGHLHIEGRKMSKSLKNFVTVRELLDGEDGVHPEAFRIFCALHRYASTVSYSAVKLAEADAARRDLGAALQSARAALGGDLTNVPRRWTAREHELHAAHRSAQATFSSTLLEDANLPEALQALLTLATRLRQHCLEAATEQRDVVPEPVTAAAAFLASSLNDLGLVETAGAWAGVSTIKESAADGALEALVAFRGQVRKAALSATDDEAKLKLRGVVLGECDGMRDANFLVKQGLALVDTPAGETLVQPRVAEAAKPKPKAQEAAFDYADTPPAQLYAVGEFAGRYGSFDESGLPLTDAAGEPVSKSQRKKLKKRLDVHAKKWSRATAA